MQLWKVVVQMVLSGWSNGIDFESRPRTVVPILFASRGQLKHCPKKNGQYAQNLQTLPRTS